MLVTVGPDNNTGFRKHIEELSFVIPKYSSKFVAVKEKGYKKTLSEIGKLKPKLTIIGGRNWIIRNCKMLDKIRGKKGILYCSPLAQAEISGEEIKNLIIYLGWLDKKKIDYLFVGSKTIFELLKRKDVIYLPAPAVSDLNLILDKKFSEASSVAILNDKALHKNIINSLAGLSLSKSVEEIIINGLNRDYALLANYLKITNKIKNVGLLNKKELYRKLRKVKLLLHLSFSEGFSYSVFESCYIGTPVLVTSAVPWIKSKELIVKDPQDTKEISQKIDYVMKMSEKSYLKLVDKIRRDARKTALKNNSICLDNLSKILFRN